MKIKLLLWASHPSSEEEGTAKGMSVISSDKSTITLNYGNNENSWKDRIPVSSQISFAVFTSLTVIPSIPSFSTLVCDSTQACCVYSLPLTPSHEPTSMSVPPFYSRSGNCSGGNWSWVFYLLNPNRTSSQGISPDLVFALFNCALPALLLGQTFSFDLFFSHGIFVLFFWERIVRSLAYPLPQKFYL